jgi:hypothetical protein
MFPPLTCQFSQIACLTAMAKLVPRALYQDAHYAEATSAPFHCALILRHAGSERIQVMEDKPVLHPNKAAFLQPGSS